MSGLDQNRVPCSPFGFCDSQTLLQRSGKEMDEGQDDLIVGLTIVLWLDGRMIGFQSLNYLNLSVDFQYPRSPLLMSLSPLCLLEEAESKGSRIFRTVSDKIRATGSGKDILINNPTFLGDFRWAQKTLSKSTHFLISILNSLSPELAVALSMLLISTFCGLHGSLGFNPIFLN